MVSVKRFHHQFFPDAIEYEDGALTDDEMAGLTALGHKLAKVDRAYGNMNVVTFDYATGKVEAATDPRGAIAGEVY
jgi:gamma-glutamyltranspeptidase/glutathione hydrolase